MITINSHAKPIQVEVPPRPGPAAVEWSFSFTGRTGWAIPRLAMRPLATTVAYGITQPGCATIALRNCMFV